MTGPIINPWRDSQVSISKAEKKRLNQERMSDRRSCVGWRWSGRFAGVISTRAILLLAQCLTPAQTSDQTGTRTHTHTHTHDGHPPLQGVGIAHQQAGRAYAHGGPRRSWQNDHPVQAEARRDCAPPPVTTASHSRNLLACADRHSHSSHKGHHHSYHRVQRRDCRLQEPQLHCMGRRWPGQDSSALEALLREHKGAHLCRRFQRS